jgi:tetratricopeptide (TPR) repeat protein
MKVLFHHKLLANSLVLFLSGVVYLFGVTSSASDPMEQARTLANTGEFQKASEVAAALGNSESLAFAAASLAVFAYEVAEEFEKPKLYKMAIRYAEMAVELDPSSSEAYLQLAHTLGRYAQTLGTMTALSEGYADQIRTAIDKAIQLDPKNYQAFLSLGAWHSEIIAAGFMAWLIYGGDEDESLQAYSMALGIAPDDNNVHYQYAVGLLKLDDTNLEQALEHLKISAELPVDDAYGEIVQRKAKQMLEELGKG